MWDIIIVIIAALVVFGGLGIIVWQFEKEHKRKEALVKKNMSFIESINLTGLPIITFHNNGQTVNMVLDTGSNVCIINEETLKSLTHEIAEQNMGIMGIGGDRESNNTVFLPLSYKDYNFDFECYVVDLSETIKSMKEEYGVTIHGLLGTGFFTKYKYILDFNDMVAYSLKKD